MVEPWHRSDEIKCKTFQLKSVIFLISSRVGEGKMDHYYRGLLVAVPSFAIFIFLTPILLNFNIQVCREIKVVVQSLRDDFQVWKPCKLSEMFPNKSHLLSLGHLISNHTWEQKDFFKMCFDD